MAGRGAHRRAALFERGARAIAQYLRDDLRGLYVCPLCVKGWPRQALSADVLALEHAPPRSLGGRVVALTCKDCNSGAGHTLDDEMHGNEAFLDFVAGNTSRPLRARIEVPDRPELSGAMVDVGRVDGAIKMVGLPKHSRPEAQRAWEEQLAHMADQGGWDGFHFRLAFTKANDPEVTSVGWLRSAYLVAFAAFGYPYILRRDLRPVRDQITHPKDAIIKPFSTTNGARDRSFRQIVLIQEPAELRSVVVQMGRHDVFLPLSRDNDIYEYLASDRLRGPRFDATVDGKIVPWPNGPQHMIEGATLSSSIPIHRSLT